MNQPYHLLQVVVIALLLYLLTWGLYRLKAFTRQTHRKIWDTLLLGVFLLAGILGVLLTLQVNYKWELSWLDAYTTIHVDAGIALVITGIIHLMWNIGYYARLFHKNHKVPGINSPSQQDYLGESSLRYMLIFLGLAGLLSQIVLLREFMLIFNGNELVISFILFFWMLLTASGAFLGRFSVKFSSDLPLLTLTILIGVIPLLTAFLISVAKNIAFPPGVMVGIPGMAILVLILLLPFCVVSGYMFSFLAWRFSHSRSQNSTGTAYALESIGSIIGGMLVNFILVYLFNSFVILLLISVLAFILSGMMAFREYRKTVGGLLWITAAVVLMLGLTLNLEKAARDLLFKNQEIIQMKDTPHGHITITQKHEQKNFFLNNRFLFDNTNIVPREEAVHYPMSQPDSVSEVLLVSGGVSGMLEELLKYSPNQIDYVEYNPYVVKLASKFSKGLDNEKVRIIHRDPRQYIRQSSKKYDVIILNIPPPSTLQANRYYTQNFFRDVKKILSTDGLLSFTLLPYSNYLDKEKARVLSSVSNTLKNHFKHIRIIPGENHYFLCSDKAYEKAITQQIERKGIETQYVNHNYLNDMQLKMRADLLRQKLNTEAAINRDFKPVVFFLHIRWWMGMFHQDPWLIGIIALVIGAILLSVMRPLSSGMFAAGFTSTSAEMMLIFAFQILYGNIYHLAGIIFTVFMAGLFAGAYYSGKIIPKPGRNKIIQVQLLLASLAILIPLTSQGIMQWASVAVYILLLGLTLATGLLTGLQFATISTVDKRSYAEQSSAVYSADLAGAAIGALLTGAFLVPNLGMTTTGGIIALLNVGAAIVIFVDRAKTKGIKS